MRIAIVSTLYPPYILGGAEISTSLLVKGLAQNGHEVHVITTGKQDGQEHCDGVTIYRLKNRNIYWRYPQREKSLLRKAIWHLADIYNIFYRPKLQSLFSQIEPDIIHTGNICGLSCIVWSLAHDFQIPVVHTLRDYYLLCPQQSMMKGSKSCDKQCFVCYSYSIVKKMISRYVDAVVGISSFILDRHLLLNYFPNATQKTVIPNSIIKAEITTKTRKFIIGYIGRLSSEKGIELMIQAFNKSNFSRYRLIIAGEGNSRYVNQLISLYQSDSVLFIGKCNPHDFFNQIDLLVVPSLWNEPFGRVVIESYSYHVPVLIADNGGLSELYRPGVSEKFSTDSVNSLTDLLNRYFDGKLSFDENAFEAIVSDYTEERMVSAYVKLYQAMLDKRI